MFETSQYTIQFVRYANSHKLIEQIGIFRKKLFVDKFGWDVSTKDGKEFDEFDTDNTIYCIIFRKNKIVGMFRAIETIHPYLTQKYFSHLSTHTPIPKKKNVWEISRFGILNKHSSPELNKIIYAALFYFSKQVSAQYLIAITDIFHERHMSRIGIRHKRYGSSQNIGKTKNGRDIYAVVGEIRPSQQSGYKFNQIMETLRKVEVIDYDFVLRPIPISA